jgi:hypothetical protein
MLKHRAVSNSYIDRIRLGFFVLSILFVSPDIALCEPASVPVSKATTALFAQIAEDGLSGTVNGGNLSIIKAACQQAHSDPDGKDWSDDSDAGVAKIFRFTDRETAKMLNLAASVDTNSEDRAKFLHQFGLVLRGLQEFYLKSNYLELKLEASNNQIDPYNVELINWTKVGHDARSIAIAGYKFGDYDKSSPKLPEGAKSFDKATYYSIAKELAVKESLREWNTIERLIRVKYPQRATDIVTALKTASCPADIKFDVDD